MFVQLEQKTYVSRATSVEINEILEYSLAGSGMLHSSINHMVAVDTTVLKLALDEVRARVATGALEPGGCCAQNSQMVTSAHQASYVRCADHVQRAKVPKEGYKDPHGCALPQWFRAHLGDKRQPT